jgi:hypothetical protein
LLRLNSRFAGVDAPFFEGADMNAFQRILLATTALVSIPFAAVHAFCGFYAGKADATLFNSASQVVIARDGTRSVLSMVNDYQGPLREFALIVPTPVVLHVGQVRIVDRAVFDHLDAYSGPRLAEYYDGDPCLTEFTWGENLHPDPVALAMLAPAPSPAAARRDRALGITVEAKYTLGEYDIVSLSARQSDGLETWLRENGYRIPKGASAALKPYINQGMKFFIAKVNLKEQMKTGYAMLRPLQFAFDSEKFMLPMRLGMLNAPPDRAQDLIVYALTRHGRVESGNYRTTNVPANVNLPAFIKPQFGDFYKATYAAASAKEDYRVVFTEYFWNMSWCDPCAAQPLTRDELQESGVFWLDDTPEHGLNSLPNRALPRRPRPPGLGGGPQPVLLTRLHLRYTPRSFPEDLMFTETNDSQNWQARYIIQHAFGGSVAECSERVGEMDCAAMCQQRISDMRSALGREKSNWFSRQHNDKTRESLTSQCMSSCALAKSQALEAASRYYQIDLPERLATERETLAQLTGWSLHDIDAIPRAPDTSALSPKINSGLPISVAPWWQRLFAK